MARNKQRKAKARNTKRRNQNSGPAPRKHRDESAAVKGMLLGGGILCLIAFLAFVRVGGETPLNHFFSLFGSDDTAAASAKPSTGSSNSNSKSSPRTIRIGPKDKQIKLSPKPKSVRTPARKLTLSPKPAISKNAGKAPPLEKLSDGDKAGLDKLIKAKGK
jgi:hypothetical protein